MSHGKGKLVIWAPYRGQVGTIKAAENYAEICRDLGFEVSFIELCDEWSSYAPVSENFPVLSLTRSGFFKNIGKSNFLHRRDFFAYAFLKIGALRRALKKLQPCVIVSMLGTVPLILAAKNGSARLVGSVQGFPKFLEPNSASNLFFRLENAVRAMFWKRYYGHLDAMVCMTPDTADRLSGVLGRDAVFCPNPLFEHIDQKIADIDERNDKLDFIAIGRFSQQKRFDLTAQFFKQVQSIFPAARLHFFGDVSKEQMKTALGDDLENVRFHGFVDELWSDVLQQRGPVHLVASDWEDPGHAILEGIEAGIPTLFINPDAAYVDFYRCEQAAVIGAAEWSGAEKVRSALETARAASSRLALKKEIAAQFAFPSVAERLERVLHV